MEETSEKVICCSAITKSGKKILIKSIEKFYPPLFKGLAQYLEDNEIKSTMTTNEVSRLFSWIGKIMTPDQYKKHLENTDRTCTCGQKGLVVIHNVTHILSNTRIIIGSTCIEHWMEDDKEFKELNEQNYINEIAGFTKSQKIYNFDNSGISYCKECFTRNEKKRCPCEMKKKRENKEREEKEKQRKIEEYKKQNEIVYFNGKEIYPLKDRAIEYIKNKNIEFKWNSQIKKWYCRRKDAYLFEIFDVEGKDLFYFEIDWKVYEFE
jgi:hypothetical protein